MSRPRRGPCCRLGWTALGTETGATHIEVPSGSRIGSTTPTRLHPPPSVQELFGSSHTTVAVVASATFIFCAAATTVQERIWMGYAHVLFRCDASVGTLPEPSGRDPIRAATPARQPGGEERMKNRRPVGRAAL